MDAIAFITNSLKSIGSGNLSGYKRADEGEEVVFYPVQD